MVNHKSRDQERRFCRVADKRGSKTRPSRATAIQRDEECRPTEVFSTETCKTGFLSSNTFKKSLALRVEHHRIHISPDRVKISNPDLPISSSCNHQLYCPLQDLNIPWWPRYIHNRGEMSQVPPDAVATSESRLIMFQK